MTSLLAWIDSSPEEAERMQRIAALFKDSDTLDELGVASIRDAFSNYFFPGTSVAMTRLKYFLFVPWLYQRLDAKRVSATAVQQKLWMLEVELIDELLKSDDTRSVIGAVSRETLRRFPSDIYWWPLEEWGIRKVSMSRSEYHEQFDAFRTLNQSIIRPDDRGVPLDCKSVWHAGLPAIPEGFPKGAHLRLSRSESGFIRDRILNTHPGSLLAHAASAANDSAVDYPWLYPGLGDLPEKLQAVLVLSRQFASLMLGATGLYYLLLAQASKHPASDGWKAACESQLSSWAEQDIDVVAAFEPGGLWRFAREQQVKVKPATQTFVEKFSRCIRELGPADAIKSREVSNLVCSHEQQVKPKRARLNDRRAIDRWEGGTADYMTYRWRTVQGLMRDLHDGLEAR